MIRAEYLPGVENVVADWESRHHNDSSNWQLSPAVFDAVSQLLGPFSIDLFASRINHQLPIYCSWRPDPGAISVDAFTMSWRDQSPYLFPPFCLIGKALLRIQRESVNQACLIAPAWPGQMWYSQLLTMLAGYPILLPQFPELPLSPDQKPHPLVLEEKLFLTAWPVSGNVTRCKAFQRGLQSSSCSPGEITPIPLTIQPGVSGIAGVLNETIIPPLSNVLQFLAEQFDTGLQYRTVNTLRSAISTTHPNIDGMAVGRHPLVSRLLRGMFNLRPPSPHYSHSWDVRIVVRFLSNCKSADLSTLQLAKKTVTLMALVNADRCSDLAALDRDLIQWTASGVKFTVVWLTKTRRSGAPREIFYPMFRDNSELRPVTVLRLYVDKTTEQAAELSSPKPVFLTSRKPFRQARPGIIGHWIKDVLRMAGVDTEVFSAHSTRSASTSWATAKGVPINDILRAANWSSQTAFEQYYLRPTTSTIFTKTILQSTSVNRYI